MVGPSCIPHKVSRKFAEQVVNKLTDEQKQKYGITDDTLESTIEAIRTLVESHVNAEPDSSKQSQMLQNVDGFISDLENFFTIAKIPEADFDNAKEQYNSFFDKLEKFGVEGASIFTNIALAEDGSNQDDALALETFLQNYSNIVSYTKEYYPDGQTMKSISFVVRTPEKSDEVSAQQKAINTIQRIKGLSLIEIYNTKRRGEIDYVASKDEIPAGWRPTGKYKYEDKIIRAIGVTRDVHGDEKYTGPVLASPIGSQVDKVGRFVFDKKSKFYDKDGNLIEDEDTLREIIDEDFRSIFTVQGLKNLINDFQKLEQQLKEKWGDDIQIISDEVRFFGKDANTGKWIVGYPDLLVVDGRGIIHTLDFKTSKIYDIRGYMTIFHDDNEREWHTGEGYGKQVTRYIRMQESYGLNTDPDPYVVLIDTYYDSSDTVTSREQGKKETYSIPEDEEGAIEIIGEQGNMPLSEYARQNPVTRQSILATDPDTSRKVLYMEPRLHVKYEEGEGKGWSDELQALRGKEDIPVDTEVSYEKQWEALSLEEKKQLKWLFNASPVVFSTAQDIVTYSDTDIESPNRPKSLSSQEISDVADFMMYKVSRTISALQRGDILDEFEASKPSSDDMDSPLKGLSRIDIVKKIGGGSGIVGIQKLIDYSFGTIEAFYKNNFPSEEEYKNEDFDDLEFYFEDENDYWKQREMSEKAKWLIDHKDQLIIAGSAKLTALENFVTPKKRKSSAEEKQDFNSEAPNLPIEVADIEVTPDMGDNNSTETTTEIYLEGLSNLEAWMMGTLNISPKSSLAQEVKRMFEDIDKLDNDNNKVMDSYGWGFSMPIDATYAIQAVLEACKYCETMPEMMDALENMTKNPELNWVKQVIQTINMKGNENLKKKFYRHFRKDSQNYSISQVKFDKKTGKRVVETRIINMKSAYDTIRQSLGSSFTKGLVGKYTINGVEFSMIDSKSGENALTRYGRGTVAHQIAEDIVEWKDRLRKLYNKAKKDYTGEAIVDYIAEQLRTQEYDGKTIVKGITEVLNGIGVMVTEDVVYNTCLKKIKGNSKTSNAGALLNTAISVLDTLQKSKNLSAFNKDTGFRDYNKILLMLSDSVQEVVEASVYQDGKTYYSYTNPSRLGHIIRNMKDSLDDPDKFKQYVENQFGRYTGWYKSVDGTRWLSDWVMQFADEYHSSARQALEHKVELSYIGNHYRDLGSLGFQLSILHNYFGSKNDQSTNDQWRWFALPTMSNKPTNEFIRMLKYKDIDKGGDDEIIDRVLMNTFEQEMNRMADVLYHYISFDDRVATDQIDLTDKKLSKAGWTEEEIAALKQRISNHTLTQEDLVKLQGVTSGAKFHFLWYLNDEISKNENSFGNIIVDRLNLLLTPNSAEKEANLSQAAQLDILNTVRERIKNRMQQIVESELEHMRSIGLFDPEIKKINGKDVKILKYQEEFGGMLGSSNNYDDAVKQMEEKLRDFIWQDIAANINIIQITGGDLAYYGNAVNYQKRIAQIHSPGLKLMHDEDYDDGYLRSVHISDENVRDEILYNTEAALNDYADKSGMSSSARKDYEKMISIIMDGLTRTESTDGQSYSSPTSLRKKKANMGEWSDEHEKAYQAIIKGDFNINHLAVFTQSAEKPFVTSDMAKYSGSTTMEIRKTPLQDKNSEYLIILAEALARGSGQRSKLVAICDFMEATHKFGNGKTGIDTTHFASVNKVGKSGIIDISAFDKEFDKMLKAGEVTEDEYNERLSEYLLSHVRTKGMRGENIQDQDDFDANEKLVQEGKLKREEALYNPQYVDTIPLDDYIIQQEVPAHLLQEQGQLYGSQIRILGISDITPGTEFDVKDEKEKMSAEKLIDEYKEIHAMNINEAFNDLMDELGVKDIDKLNEKLIESGVLLSKDEFLQRGNYAYDTDKQKQYADRAYNDYVRENTFESIAELPVGTPERNIFFKNLELILQKALTKDAKYGLDMYRACTLQYDNYQNVIDFAVPLQDPIQSRRIQELINSIIKKSINKQRITGGPVVQTTAYDRNLHIRFKDKNGNILKTLSEYGGNIAAYKEYLNKNQAGIAYFECYMPIPNATLERLMTNPDGSMMSFEEAQQKLPKEVWDSMSQVIGYRIPTEDKYSMVPLKIVGFVPRAAGQVIMMPQEITYLTGSDFDIDKMYIMMKSFKVKGEDIEKSQRDTHWQNLVKEYFKETGNRWNYDWEKPVKEIIKMGDDIINGNRASWSREPLTLTDKAKWADLEGFITWYRNRLLGMAFKEQEYIKKNADETDEAYRNRTKDRSRFDLRKGRDNRLIDLQWAVLTNEDTASKMLNPGNFIEQKKVGRIIRILKSKAIDPNTDEVYDYETLKEMEVDELDDLLENADPHNSTLPSSKIYFQHQNMQGTQMVGIFANNNVSHAFMTFQKVGIDLHKGKYDNSFMFDGHTIGSHEDPTVLDPQIGFNGQLISKTIASFLAASVDTAKDPTLADMNINTFTGGVAMVLARIGFDTASIGLFLSQPVIMELSDLYFKKSTNGFYTGDIALEELATTLGITKNELQDTTGIKDETLSIDNFIEHLNDTDYAGDKDNFQKRVLKGFYRLYQIAHDLQELTFCTKFNSVSNAVGPTIADTMEDFEKVEKFTSETNNSFYIPSSDNDPKGFTDPRNVIDNDKILQAFYDTTVGSDGASERIFKNFFPHYYKGFQNVKQYFQETYLGGKRIPSKLYNQLLSEYLYYLMTYQGEEFMPTLPYTQQQKDRLVSGLVTDFNAILAIKGRKPNILLDQVWGANCLRIRGADEFLAVDTLIFNSSQLNADNQQKVRNAWSDLITVDDPNLSEDENMMMHRFGVDLFYYNLMRNGFTFSPKTMMTLASVVVRYNATYDKGFSNYINGLRNLRKVDGFLMNGPDKIAAIKRFCSQFIRNHANNKQIIPNVDSYDKNMDIEMQNGSIVAVEFHVPQDKESDLYYIGMSNDNPPRPFITITKKEGKKLSQELYELEETFGGDKTFIDNKGETRVRYKKSTRLGLTNNFIEYDANSDLESSYFTEIREKSADDSDDESGYEANAKTDREKTLGGSDAEENMTFTGYWNTYVVPMIKKLEGPQSVDSENSAKYRKALKQAMQNADDASDLANAFNQLMEAKKEERQGIMDRINKIYSEENKCATV